MLKMHYFSYKFSKNHQALGFSALQRSLSFDFDDPKLRDLAKLCVFLKLIMTKSNLKK